jgi:trehalose 2-sulfotransferase
MICAVPRTGSYLLCDLLEKTGLAGHPNEYFNPSFQSPWAVEWKTKSIHEYMETVSRVATTENGVFGLKAHPMQFDAMCRQLANKPSVPFVKRPQLLAQWLPRLSYIQLRREDRLRQAISYARAIQTNGWWDSEYAPGPSGPVRPEQERFDFQLITRALELLRQMDQRWKNYFATIGATPLVISYESLIDSPRTAVESILNLLGVDQPAPPSDHPMPFRRQADELTEMWAARYERIRNEGVASLFFAPPLSPRHGALTRVREWSWPSQIHPEQAQ